jgi:hypothetical protein
LEAWDNIYWPSSLPPVDLKEHTLELRMDLVRASADDVFLVLGVQGSSGYYHLGIDQNEIALIKADQGDRHIASLFWTPAPVANQNVTVTLAFSQVDDVLLIALRVEETGTGRLIHERLFADTAGVDVPAPQVPPKGLTFLGPDPGPPIVSFYLAYAGVFQYAISNPAPVEMVVDNLEYWLYDAPILDSPAAMLLSWSPDTLDEQIVVGADALDSTVWTPWPEPIFKRHGELAMAIPILTAPPHRFFKPVPGTQFVEDFDPPKPPYLTKGEWIPHFFNAADASKWESTEQNGALHLRTIAPPADGRTGMLPPGPDLIVADFNASIDFHGFQGTGSSTIGIGARMWRDDPWPGNSNGYIGALSLNPARLTIWNGGGDEFSPEFSYDPTTRYRLIFTGVGTELSVRLVDLATSAIVSEKSISNTQFRQGMVFLYADTVSGGSFDITLDNFVVTGTKPQ